MEKEVLNLLERSFLFPSGENPRYSVGLKTHRMEFPFISRQIFFEHANSDKLQDFERYIYHFILRYIKTWVSKNSDTVERKNEDIFQYLFDFRKNFNHEDVFSKICDGNDWVKIEIGLNNSIISIKRFGNCLGLLIGHGNDIHETGFLALEEMTSERDGLIKPFVHRIECSIPLPKEHAKENSENISFVKIYEMFREALPYVDWAPIDSWIYEMILQYIEVSWNNPTPEDGVFVGMCANIPIKAMLVHTECRDFQKTKPWRNGNVSLVHETSLTHNFCEADDLRLVLMAHCGNRRYASFTKHDTRLDTEDIQRRLLLVGAMLYNSLCTMFSVYNATHDHVLA